MKASTIQATQSGKNVAYVANLLAFCANILSVLKHLSLSVATNHQRLLATIASLATLVTFLGSCAGSSTLIVVGVTVTTVALSPIFVELAEKGDDYE